MSNNFGKQYSVISATVNPGISRWEGVQPMFASLPNVEEYKNPPWARSPAHWTTCVYYKDCQGLILLNL